MQPPEAGAALTLPEALARGRRRPPASRHPNSLAAAGVCHGRLDDHYVIVGGGQDVGAVIGDVHPRDGLAQARDLGERGARGVCV